QRTDTMDRRRFIQTSAAAAAGILAARGGHARPVQGDPLRWHPTSTVKEPVTMTIRDYLCREARRISDATLSGLTDAAAWERLIPERRRQYMEMMNLQDLPPDRSDRPALNPRITGTLEREGYRIEKLYYESLPKLYVTANLYVPTNVTGRSPGIVYVCGHSPTQKVRYQPHARRWAQLGFVTLIVETVQFGEVRGHHHGCYREGWWHWYSRGYTSATIELLNAIRGLDLLQERAEVDPERLGVTGISGGGAMSWWLAAGDERIKCAAPVCGTATLASHIIDRTIDGHCDCMWWINTYLWDLADVGALIAPRPLMIASADRDGIFTIASIREVHERLRPLYDALGASEDLALVETPGPHSYHERSRTAIFSWFLHHLQGEDVPPEEVGDVDESEEAQESEDDLRVFVAGPLKEDRTLTIHDDFREVAGPPEVADREAVVRTRDELVGTLREKTFRFFPAEPVDVDARVAFEFRSGSSHGYRFGFTPEQGWRLHGRLTIGDDVEKPAPAVVSLWSPGDSRNDARSFAGRVRGPWARLEVELRGTGETSWGQELQWHIRRAAGWTGRTIAGMRVYDALRALQAVRSLPDVDEGRVALAARGEMAAVALYAALLDGNLAALILESPPATQNEGSNPDGSGPAIEMLNCLRHTDLPYVAGLLCPLEIIFVGERPGTYDWARDLYARLGVPGKFHEVGDIREWRP
ncbi:MAG: acetylxylan esterase, partial [Armatimonadota bacterium]